MKGRRFFLKSSLLAAVALLTSRPSTGRAAPEALPPGLVYTADRPGRWAGKEGSHAPKVVVAGKEVTIRTEHPMSAEHYIVRHTLLSPDGTFIGAKTFSPADGKAESVYSLPEGAAGALYATSFCNLHDFWLTTFTI